jgi:aspartyl-tRNA(Asn)/glutamyl-tRNA(Gln) amidotransferase subunit A
MRLHDAQRAIEAGELSPGELLECCLARIPDAQRSGAFVVVDESGARRAAARLPRRPRGPLHGVPCAVKDLVDVAGLPTAAGRASGTVAVADAPIVRRLRDAGAIIVGKTRTDELGLGTLTPGACDPREPGRSVGGSSGGSAIAVAVGAVALAVATDTAGSARIPAAACGVAGLCASVAGLPAGGTVALSPSFDRLGLIAADAIDLTFVWRALTGSVPAWSGRVKTLSAAALGRVDEVNLAAAREAAWRLGGGVVTERAGPSLADFALPRAIVVTADAARRHCSEHAESPVVRRQLREGAAREPEAVTAARERLSVLGDELRAAVGDGILVTPTLASPPPRWEEVADTDSQLHAIGRLTRLCGPVNSSGLVAVSVPWSSDASGRPLAVQLTGASEATVLAAAIALTAQQPRAADVAPT